MMTEYLLILLILFVVLGTGLSIAVGIATYNELEKRDRDDV